MSGFFITFEGGEGAGKSSQIQTLAQHFKQSGHQVLLTRQPGGSQYGRAIRQLILDPNTEEFLSAKAELFLYLADRAHHVDTVIQPALDAGKIVLCDRYLDSTLAYQGYGRGLDLKELKTLNQIATSGLTPHLTLWLDIDPTIGMQRIQIRAGKDRLEQEAISFHERVRSGYQSLAKQEPERWRRLDATQSIEQVFEKIKNLVTPYL